MAALTKLEAAQLTRLLKSDDWGVLEKYINHYIETQLENGVSGTNAFETLKSLHQQQGKIAGLTEVLGLLENQAFK